MLSPFPGMDPFLEDPVVFPDFHDRFIAYLSEELQSRLPEPYYAALGRRAWVETTERFIGPDVDVISSGQQARNPAAPTATLDSTRPIIIHVPHDEQVETLVEIYIGRGNDRRLVTAIELLSPANKTVGEHGRELYRRKQSELIASKTHLIEIDLLRGGEHTTAVPEHRFERQVPSVPYHVCLHRFDKFEDYFIYPIGVRHPLPTIPVPLLPGDADVDLDLQQVFQRTYAAGPYARELDYRGPVPPPTLSKADETWIQELLGHSH